MKQIFLRVLGFGFLIWLVPFIVAFGFYTPEGKLQGDFFVFKTTMLLVGNLTGCFFLALLSKRISRPAFGTFLGISIFWLLENWGLDFLILLPMNKMGAYDYFVQIGLRYLTMLMIGPAIGYAIDKHK